MSVTYYTRAPSYAYVEEYVNNGLPEDHWMREDMSSEDEDSEPPLKKGTNKKKGPRKVWSDTESKEYANYPNDILYSARYMDGLTMELYPDFYHAFSGPGQIPSRSGATWWHEKFFQHARVVFNYHWDREIGALESAELPADCHDDTHHLLTLDTKLVSGHQIGWCDGVTYQKQSSFLNFCMCNIEGYQSQTLMREKFFLVLEYEALNFS